MLVERFDNVGLHPVLAICHNSLHGLGSRSPHYSGPLIELFDVHHQIPQVGNHALPDTNADAMVISEGCLAIGLHALDQLVDMTVIKLSGIDGVFNKDWAFTTILGINNIEAGIAKESLGNSLLYVGLGLVKLLQPLQLCPALVKSLETNKMSRGWQRI